MGVCDGIFLSMLRGKTQPDLVAHTLEAEVEGVLGIPGQPGLHNEF